MNSFIGRKYIKIIEDEYITQFLRLEVIVEKKYQRLEYQKTDRNTEVT